MLYDRSLDWLEVRQLFDGHSLNDALAAKNPEALRSYYLTEVSPATSSARAELATAIKKYYRARNPVEEISVMEELPEPRPAYVLARGRYDAPRTETNRVSRSTPAFLLAFPTNAPRNRLGLAAWATDPRHPLTEIRKSTRLNSSH